MNAARTSLTPLLSSKSSLWHLHHPLLWCYFTHSPISSWLRKLKSLSWYRPNKLEQKKNPPSIRQHKSFFFPGMAGVSSTKTQMRKFSKFRLSGWKFCTPLLKWNNCSTWITWVRLTYTGQGTGKEWPGKFCASLFTVQFYTQMSLRFSYTSLSFTYYILQQDPSNETQNTPINSCPVW